MYQQGGGIAWEYFFDYSGGRAPWLSGMAQAVAAQAFARTAALVPDQETALMREARAAYRAIPSHLLTSVAAGPWIRLYSFQSLRVLNAQLQAIVSLQSYATTAEDPDAAALAARMQRAAAATLPSFDTGYWTYYSLPHETSPLDYQQFVVQLLKKLAPSDPRFADAATRFAAYRASAARVQAHERIARSAALLAVKAGDRAGEHRRRPDQAARARRRLAHARVARAEASGRLPRARHRRRLGREQRVVRRAADRACDCDRSRDCRAQDLGVDEVDAE